MNQVVFPVRLNADTRSAGEPHNWRGFSLLEGYLHGADGYTCPLTGSSDYRYRLYGNDDTFAVRGLYSVHPKLSHPASLLSPSIVTGSIT